MEKIPEGVGKQPAWIPEWAWRAYTDDCNGLKGANRLAEAKEAASVWAAIEKAAASHPEPESYARLFFWEVSWALDFSGDVTLEGSERRRRAQAVTKAARSLTDAIRDTGIPDAQMRQFADAISARMGEVLVGDFGPIESGGNGIDRRSFELGAHFAAREASLDLEGLLDALVRDAEAWATGLPKRWATDVVVPRPNKPTAARTYFVRRMTQHFFQAFGSPLRALTLALTSLFFNCETMTTAEIASIAPVRDQPEA